jgi:site-specific recombinase XerD
MSGIDRTALAPIDGLIITPQMELAARLTDEWHGTLDEGNTAAAYANDLNLWRTWCAANGIDPLTARKSDTGKWIREQQARGFAKRTIARRVSAVAAWYEFLHEETANSPVVLAAENPARTRKRPKVARDDSPTLGLSKAHARQLILAADADSLRSGALMRFLLGNGLRVGTVVSARIEDVAEDDGHHVIFLRGKGDVRRKAPIPPPGYNAITKMLAERSHPTEGPLFATSTGRPVDRHYIFRLVRRLAVRAEIPSAAHLSPHSLRHSFATEALKRGVSLHQLQDDMWHADSRTTEIYNRARNRLDKSAAYVVAGEFEPVTDDE